LNPTIEQTVPKIKSSTYFLGKNLVNVSNNNVIFVIIDPTDTQNEPKTSFSSLKPDDLVQFLEYISFPQQSALKHLLTDEH